MKQKEQAFIYVRVLSNEKEETGFSIPAQVKYLQEYAKKKALKLQKFLLKASQPKKQAE